MDNQKLIQDCIKNKRGAQQALYKSYANVFFRLAFRYVKHKEDAEDVVLESFMQIFDHMSAFIYHSEAQTEAWMKRIVINQALKKLRKANSFLFTDFDQVEMEDHSAVGIEDYMTANEILDLICTLPPGYRTVFNLFVVEGYSHNEIAGMLNITENTSRSQLFKAKAFLKEKIERRNRNII
ncbi:sigma-70 family RNA polymerase sigma factor [Emticicia sp. CRIBPO]|uniref:RNA polymerase sigma factor n=1 Tax=Emticicia sp. CRIBPO TaxID=2683258 RepID=UPI00141338E1|nr:sigma-70 family RNA polymerase sigma factor [Emticicia sp. CRIBPO]NBA85022.1 sigma-70 family RNA polymerase sigma factor [Emticicia sp. CRIBPO]